MPRRDYYGEEYYQYEKDLFEKGLEQREEEYQKKQRHRHRQLQRQLQRQRQRSQRERDESPHTLRPDDSTSDRDTVRDLVVPNKPDKGPSIAPSRYTDSYRNGRVPSLPLPSERGGNARGSLYEEDMGRAMVLRDSMPVVRSRHPQSNLSHQNRHDGDSYNSPHDGERDGRLPNSFRARTDRVPSGRDPHRQPRHMYTAPATDSIHQHHEETSHPGRYRTFTTSTTSIRISGDLKGVDVNFYD